MCVFFVQKCFAQLFSSYVLALAKKHFCTKNACVNCWWNWPQFSVDWNFELFFEGKSITDLSDDWKKVALRPLSLLLSINLSSYISLSIYLSSYIYMYFSYLFLFFYLSQSVFLSAFLFLFFNSFFTSFFYWLLSLYFEFPYFLVTPWCFFIFFSINGSVFLFLSISHSVFLFFLLFSNANKITMSKCASSLITSKVHRILFGSGLFCFSKSKLNSLFIGGGGGVRYKIVIKF
jgi:hypothetical protein